MGVKPLDIVVTIPKSEYANDDRETAVFERGGYEQFWQLSKKPRQLAVGERVYFVKHNKIESSMRVKRVEVETAETCEVTGRTWNGCLIFMDDLKSENIDMPIRGFQGFRYKWW